MVIANPSVPNGKNSPTSWRMTTTTDNDESGMVVVIAKLDAVHNTETKERFGVTGFPTLLYFADEKVYKYQGPRTVQALKEFVLEG